MTMVRHSRHITWLRGFSQTNQVAATI
jgi:hypothetical protein